MRRSLAHSGLLRALIGHGDRRQRRKAARPSDRHRARESLSPAGLFCARLHLRLGALPRRGISPGALRGSGPLHGLPGPCARGRRHTRPQRSADSSARNRMVSAQASQLAKRNNGTSGTTSAKAGMATAPSLPGLAAAPPSTFGEEDGSREPLARPKCVENARVPAPSVPRWLRRRPPCTVSTRKGGSASYGACRPAVNIC